MCPLRPAGILPPGGTRLAEGQVTGHRLWPGPGLFSPRPPAGGPFAVILGTGCSVSSPSGPRLFRPRPLTSHIPTLPFCRHRLEEGQATSWSRRLKVFLCCTRTKDSQSVSTGKPLPSGSHPAVGPSGALTPWQRRVGQGWSPGFKQDRGDRLITRGSVYTDRLPPAGETTSALLCQGDRKVPRPSIHPRPLGTYSLV